MKTKKIKVRQGFTIVELVIVIGVIGVLSAVLIPTFINLNQKANQAADESLVKNLNTQLAMRKQTEGANRTMSEALADALDAGYKVENLTPKGNKDIVWNQETDQFAQLESAPAEDAYKYWTVAKKPADLEKGYSSYLYYQPAGDITTTAGFDVGEYSDINVTYNKGATAKTDVRIRTNGGVLKINADTDTVSHYAGLQDLTIDAVASASYHEYGYVIGKATVSRGHVVIESTGNIPEVAVKNVEAGQTVKVTANASTLVTVDTASAERATVVANVQEVYVSGLTAEKISGSQASKVELPTAVTNETELEAAFVGKKGFIKLGADFDASAAHVNNTNAILDFAGHTITSSLLNESFIENNAKLKIMDSGSNGGIVSANNHIVKNNKDLTIESGKFSANRADLLHADRENQVRAVINNAANATMVINDIELFAKTDFGVFNEGSTTINGGSFTSEAESYNNLCYGYCVSSYGGNLVLNGGTITGVHGCIGINAGEATINDVHAETVYGHGNPYRALYVAGEKDRVNVIVNGGYFKSYKYEAAAIGNNSDGGLGRLATAIINGGTFINGSTSATPAIKIINADWTTSSNYGLGEATINGGKFSSNVTGANGVYTCVQGSDGLWVVNA